MHSKTTKIIAGISIAVILIAGSFYAGIQYAPQFKTIKITDSKQIIDADFNLFWNAINTLKQKYVNPEDINDNKLLYGAINGALGSLDDPYTVFFNPDDAKKFDEDLSGSFGGIGAEIGIRKGQLMVISPLKGNPAEEVGLKSGDKILEVDKKSTANFTIDQAVELIRGKEGTKVTLLIFRDGWKEPKEFEITRRIVEAPTLDFEMKDNNIAYIQLYSFNAKAFALFNESAFRAMSEGAKGIVLDLRNDPGGYLDIAVQIAGWFFEPGQTVVKENIQGKDFETLKASGNGYFSKMPVVALVNGGSASASEIMAGALRDNNGVKLVGEKTFGKGSVQELQNLPGGSTMKVTIAEWLTPNGSHINKKGLDPDYEVKMPDDGVINGKNDVQLEKALEIIKGEIK